MRSGAEIMAKPNFSQTCNRFSQYLKQMRSNGSAGDHFTLQNLCSPKLDINNGVKEISGPTNNTTMNLFPKNMEKQRNVSTGERSSRNIKSLDLFPMVSSSAVTNQESTKNIKEHSRELPKSEEPKEATTPSMTIFYGGRVLVFDDLPEDKAQEIMALASQGMLNSARTQIQTQTQIKADQVQSPSNNSSITPQLNQGAVVAGSSDLPIARRSSLHRFMDKRKHRIAATAPYQLHNSSQHEQNTLMTSSGEQQEQPDEPQLELKLF